MLAKAKPLRSQAIRNSARGEACTVRIPGVCDGGGETTVLAHLRMLGGCGMGQKPSDLQAVYACATCHDVIDSRSQVSPVDGWQLLAAMNETHARMVAKGLLIVRGAK